MNKYIIDEITNFKTSNIPLIEYPKKIKEIKHKINKYTDIKLLYLKKMLYKKQIDEEEYNLIKIIIDYERDKYQQMLYQR